MTDIVDRLRDPSRRGPTYYAQEWRDVDAIKDEAAAEIVRLQTAIEAATKLAMDYGRTDGAHHKAWVIDQIVRVLAGAGYGEIVGATPYWDGGIPMAQVIVEQKGAPKPPPTLPLAPLDEHRVKQGEREWLRGPLSRETSYRLLVSGEIGPKEIGKLIKVLEAQKAVLDDEDEEV